MTRIEQRNLTLSQNRSKCPKCSKELETLEEQRHNLCVGCLKAEIHQARIESVPSILADYGIPTKYRRMDWKLNEVLTPYLDTPRGVCMTGPVGVGKTVNLCLLARDWVVKWSRESEISPGDILCYQLHERQAESSWHFISFPRFVMEIQDAWRRGDEAETAMTLLRRVSDVPRLIIDDLGAEKLTDYIRQAIYFLLNEREQWDRTTYLTTNFTLKQLDIQFDSRISSRIAGMCDIKALKGEDQRIQKR